jgi:hypothetical protein
LLPWPRASGQANSPFGSVEEKSAILISFLGAFCSMIEIARNQTAAMAARIYEPFALLRSLKQVAT